MYIEATLAMAENKQTDGISENIEDIYTTAIDSADVITETPLRLWTVGEDLSYTGTNIESTDPTGKAYYETIIQQGHGTLGSTLATVAVAPIFIALWYKMYEKFVGEPYRKSYDHFLAKLKKAKMLYEQKQFNDELFTNFINQITDAQQKTEAERIFNQYIKKNRVKANQFEQQIKTLTDDPKTFFITKWFKKRQLQKKLNQIEYYEQIFWLQLEAQLYLQQQNQDDYKIDFTRIDKITYLKKSLSSNNTYEGRNEISESSSSSQTHENSELVEPTLKPKTWFDRFAKWYEKKSETNPVARIIQGAWKILSTQSMAFWIVMLPAMLLFGGSAIAGSALLSWSILGLSVLPLMIFGGVKLGTYLYRKLKKQPTESEDKKHLLQEEAEEKYVEAVSADSEKLSDEFKIALFLKLRQEKYRADLEKLETIKKQLKKPTTQLEPIKPNTTDSEALLAIEEQNNNPNTPLLNTDQLPANSLLYQKLTGSKKSQTASTAINVSFAAVGGFVIPQFLLWVGSFLASAISLSGVTAAATAATLIGGPVAMFAVGIPLMLFFTINAVLQNRVKRLDEQREILKAITEKDKSGKPLYVKYQEIVDKKDKAKELRISIAEKRQQIDQKLNSLSHEQKALLSEDGQIDYRLWKLSGHDPKKGRTYDTIKKHRLTGISPLEHVKTFFKALFNFTAKAQTGILVTRFLLLGTVGLAGLLAVSTFPIGGFLIAAGLFGTVLGGCALAKFFIDRKQQKQKDILNNLSTYLEIKDENLKTLEKIDQQLGENVEMLGKIEQADITYSSYATAGLALLNDPNVTKEPAANIINLDDDDESSNEQENLANANLRKRNSSSSSDTAPDKSVNHEWVTPQATIAVS